MGRGEDTVPGVPPSAQAHLGHLEYEGGGGPAQGASVGALVRNKQYTYFNHDTGFQAEKATLPSSPPPEKVNLCHT